MAESLDFFTNPGTSKEDEALKKKEEAERKEQEELEKELKRLEKQEKFNEQVEKLVKPLQVDENTPKDDESLTKEDKRKQDYVDLLGLYVRACFEDSESARKIVEDDWISALKQYKGIYSPEILAKIVPNRSRAYVRITRTKVKTVDSRLVDLLFPANGDKNWEITPTALPDYSEKKKEAIIKLYEEENGEKISPAKLDSLIIEEAARQARKMSKTINDQLQELRYREIMREVIHSGNVYGTGILKGPLVSIIENHQYYKTVQENGKEKWILKDYDRIIPFCENVRLWDIYPDMESTSFADTRYIVQRRKMNKQDLVQLSKRSDFAGEVIKKYLKDFPSGNYEKKAYELVLNDIGDIYPPSHNHETKSRKYEVLEYWGYVDTYTLEQWGMEIPEDKQGWLEIPCNVWVLDNKVIKAAINPIDGLKWPYFVYYFDKDETSIFGEGIPSIMRTMQEMTNAAFRAMLDNAAISAGPQLEVNLDLLSEDEDPKEVHPFKVWLRTGTGLDASNPCIRHIPMQSYTREFETMLSMFSTYSDEITTIPRYMWGDTDVKGAGRTSSGLSMLMGSANMAIKDQVKNFDDGITTPFIRAMYHWNMQFNEDEDIKGDYNVIARGSASLIAKEMYTQYLINFLNITNNPSDASIIKRPDIIRSVADAFDLNSDKFILSDSEIAAQRQQEQEEQQKQMDFMNTIVEAARENGTSPDALVSAMKNLLTQQKQLLQIQQEMSSRQPPVENRNYYFTNAPGQRTNPSGF